MTHIEDIGVWGAAGMAVAMVGLVAAATGGCGGDADDDGDPVHVDVVEECDNVNPDYCMLPWPSDRYLVADETTATGFRVDYPVAAFPDNEIGDEFDPSAYNRLDGFSPASQMLTVFPEPVDDTSLPSYTDYEASLAADSPTVVLDMDTGERVAHFAEFDVRFDDPSAILLYIRPAQRLSEGGHYAVAIRDLVVESDGRPVEPSPVFAALRDGTVTDSPQVEARRAGFEEMFDALEAAGVERESLIQAWHFHTASGEMLWGDLLAMRDDALTRLDDMTCRIDLVEEYPEDEVARLIYGTFTVPLYMDSPYPPARVVRGEDGTPEYQGMTDVEFLVNVPRSVAEGHSPGARLVLYGHGLMGSMHEIRWGAGRAMGDELGVVQAATVWAGMSEDDLVTVATALSNISTFPAVAERLMQGVVNMMLLPAALRGPCAELEELQLDGELVYDPDQVYFLGISQGGIFGGTLLALSPDIERGVLNVGASNYPVMIGRSVDFEEYELVYNAWYPARIDREFYMALMQQMWDMAEPATFLPHLTADPLPGSTAKTVIYQVGLNDAQVPNVASDMAIRTMGIPQFVPTVHEVWGSEEVTDARADGSVAQYWDCGDDPVPEGNAAPDEDQGCHENTRRFASAMGQMDAFWQPDGTAQNLCQGPCDSDD